MSKAAGWLLAAALLLGLAALAALLGAEAGRLAAGGGLAPGRLEPPALPLAALRAGLALALAASWPRLAALAARRRRWSPEAGRAFAALRWRILLWFCAAEAVLVQGGRIAAWISG